jgi:hypothetical protein
MMNLQHVLSEEALDRCLRCLRHELGREYPGIDEHVLESSIEDALLRHLARPERFDAARGVPLASYLVWWTRSYLDRRLRKEQRRQEHEKVVDVSGEDFEKFVSENRAGRSIYLRKERGAPEEGSEALDDLLALLNPCDRAEAELLREGASLAEWVRHLRIEHLPLGEQRDMVNAEKDRLRKKLQRLARRRGGG